MIDFFVKKYGKENVARIATCNRLQIRAAIKSVAKVTKFMSDAEANKLTKSFNKNATTNEKVMELTEFKSWYGDEKNRVWFDKYIEPVLGLAGHAGIHAAGIVITPEPIVNFMPLKLQEKKKETGEGIEDRLTVTQFEGSSIEEIGLLKFDVLGVNTLNALDYTLKLIKERRGIDVDLDKIDLDNPRWYPSLGNGDTVGVFQLDTPTSNRLVKEVKPQDFQELMVTVSLTRPGTAGPGLDMEYCRRKRGKAFEYDHPLLESVLQDTFGISVYQEQTMKVSNVVGGLTLVEADKLRKIMKKKDHAQMRSYQEKFIKGALERGCKDRAEAFAIWKKIESWSGYGFNAAHAAAYAQVSVWCIAMKILSPFEFFVGLLEAEAKIKLKLIYDDIKRHGIKVKMPDVNFSKEHFSIQDEAIIWTLSSGKNIGFESAKHIAMNAPYKSVTNLIEKVDKKFVNKRVVDALISINAFGSIYDNPREVAIEYYQQIRNDPLPPVFDSNDERYWDSMFYRVMGFHLRDPLELYGEQLKPCGRLDTFEEFIGFNTFQGVKIAGYVSSYRKIMSKRGEMAMIRVESDAHEFPIVVWNSFFRNHQIKKMSDNEIIGSFVFVFGEKNYDPQGNDQIQLGDPHEDRLEFVT